jgi:hypothetical protein
MTFALGYIHPVNVTHGFMESVLRLVMAAQDDVVVIAQFSGPLLARHRNEVVEGFLSVAEPKLDGMLFVDTDIIFTVADVKAIMSHPYPIVGGVYMNHDYSDSPDETFPVFNVGEGKDLRRGSLGDLVGSDGPRVEPFRVSGVGMGFTYVRREVLEDLDTGPLWPFAEYEDGFGNALGEDIGFCFRARERGWTIWVDPSIRLGHMKEAIL